MTTATKIPDSTPIEEIVSALRAQKHLKAAGILTLGDVRTRGIPECMGIKFVGMASVEELKAAIGPQTPDATTTAAAPDEEPEYEENGLPVLLDRTPSGPSRIAWVASHKVSLPGGGGGIQQPIWIEFDHKGRAQITAIMWFMRKFRRDRARADAAVEEGRPWRQECVDALRREFSTYGNGFIVLTD